MVTITNIAERILNENNYTPGDISKTKLEYLIDNAIDYVNLEAGTTIADLSGTAESKSITATEAEVFTVKIVSAIMLRAYKDRGPQTSIGGISVTTMITDPQYDFYTKLINKTVERLKQPPIYITNDPVPTSE